MPKVEDETRAISILSEDTSNLFFDIGMRRKEHRRVKVALHRDIISEQGTRLSKVDMPVETNDIAPRSLDQRQHGPAVPDKIDDRGYRRESRPLISSCT